MEDYEIPYIQGSVAFHDMYPIDRIWIILLLERNLLNFLWQTHVKKRKMSRFRWKKNITKYYVSNEQLYPKDETLIRLYQAVSKWIILMAVFGLKNEISIKLKPLLLFTRPVILHMAEKITANFSFSTNFASLLDKDGLF